MRSAVLVIGFRRPDHLARVLDRVRAADPPRVYIAIDGARSDSDVPGVSKCRDVARSVNWAPTELRLRSDNLGCQRGVIDAVTWMLDRESDGIIVEDDSLPSASFFPFCDELLERYRTDRGVLAISGESRAPQSAVGEKSYRFTYMGPAGAWATWRDRWNDFLNRRIDRNPVQVIRTLAGSRYDGWLQRAHWSALAAANRTRVMDSWAYPFMLEGVASHRLTATPNVNLVVDHGIGTGATHMQTHDHLQQIAGEVSFPLDHPQRVDVDERAERWSEEHEVGFGARRLLSHGLTFSRRFAGR